MSSTEHMVNDKGLDWRLSLLGIDWPKSTFLIVTPAETLFKQVENRL